MGPAAGQGLKSTPELSESQTCSRRGPGSAGTVQWIASTASDAASSASARARQSCASRAWSTASTSALLLNRAASSSQACATRASAAALSRVACSAASALGEETVPGPECTTAPLSPMSLTTIEPARRLAYIAHLMVPRVGEKRGGR